MKPSELYTLEVKKTWTDLWMLKGCYYSHVPELNDSIWNMLDFKKNVKAEVRAFGYVDYDGRRFWLLAGVYFERKPVMIIQNAGREGDDFHGRFITDPVGYFEMIKYLASLASPQIEAPICVVDLEKDIPNLDNFYGDELQWVIKGIRPW